MKKLGSAVLSLALLMGVCMTGCQNSSGSSQATAAATADEAATADSATADSASYSQDLFDTSYVHEMNVELSEEDWKDLLANPLKKTKYTATVTIDGNKVENVSFATKGNTSLSQVASSDSDRYSFKINFGKNVKGQTYQGLDKLNLNNIMSDATYMKDYLSYMIMREAGVNASLTSYVSLSVNGKLHGLYIAIEDVSDSFLKRNYGSADGALYKPETEQLDNAGNAPNQMASPNGAGENATMPSQSADASAPSEGGQMPQGNMQPPQGDGQNQPPSMPQGGMQPPSGGGQMPQGGMMQPPQGDSQNQPPSMPQGGMQPSSGDGQMPQGGPPGMGGSSKGADLVYSDDSRDSYSDIFDNEENDVSEDDEKKMIAAIKALNSGENLEQYWNMDEIIRYFVAHNFVLNYDSYTGNMLHNYYLYEKDGRVSVLPWDYNLAFGGFQGGNDATAAVNWAIDSPLSGATEDSRPLWKVIVSNKTYLDKYHQYYSELMNKFFTGGKCAKEIDRVCEMIRPYVEKDPSAFYKLDEFDAAVKTLKAFCEKRAESIGKQLSGKLGSTSETQKTEDKVDASDLTLSVMGTQGGGRDGGGMPPNGMPGMNTPQAQNSQSQPQPSTAAAAST